jgi:ribosomal protein S27AE
MKNKKICPKCQSSSIVRVDGFRGVYGSGNYIMTSFSSAVIVNRYICCSCGYTEEWIDEEDIETVLKSSKAKR